MLETIIFRAIWEAICCTSGDSSIGGPVNIGFNSLKTDGSVVFHSLGGP